MTLAATFGFLPMLLDTAIKSALVMTVAVLVTLAMFRLSAAWRHLVWCLAVVSLLFLPLLTWTLPAWRVHWLPNWSTETPPKVVHVSPRVGMIQPFEPNVDATSRPDDATAPDDGAATQAVDPLPYSVVTYPGEPRPSVSWPLLAWAAGAIVSLVPLVLGLWQLAQLRRQSQPLVDPHWTELVDALRTQLRIQRPVRLRLSRVTLAPLTWGALRPVLLVPADAEQWSQSRRRLVLLHELAHVCRWDWLTQLVAHLACAVYWFNPLVWLAARQMRIERERACDDLVLAHGAKASDYAQELLALATNLRGARFASVLAVPMARGGTLEDRVRGILDGRRRRAALTLAAVGVGALLSAAAVLPVAMLRAAAPKGADRAAPAPAPVPAPAPAVNADPAAKPAPAEDPRTKGITITVLNATGDKVIPEFRVLAGVSSGSVSADFEKRTGKTIINWQPHTCRIGKDGEYIWPLDKAYGDMALRVEADGYQPQIMSGVKKANGVQHIVFQLAKDEGVAGRVLTPAGKPAAGATVALGVARQDIVWDGRKIRGSDQPLPEKPGDQWVRPRLVKTDEQGEFRLPTEIEPAAVLVIHESGVRELTYAAWRESPHVQLEGWGRIDGAVLWRDKPGADEEVSLSVHRDEYGYPGMIAGYATTRTDPAGKFTFDRVLPGLTQISRPIKTEASKLGITSVILNGMFQHPKVAAGKPTAVLLGGQGRKVSGKFVGLESWEGATFHFHPEAPHIGLPGDNAMWKAFGELKASAIGPILFRDKQPINKDGTFTIEHVLPGRYQLFLSAPGFTRYAASAQFVVDSEVPGRKPEAMELGEVATATTPAAQNGNQPGGGAVNKPVDNTDRKPDEKPAVKSVTVHGKVVDDATGQPVAQFIVQAGKFDVADPKKVTWGYSESRSSATDGTFTATVRWAEGWTARVIADGYIPLPVLASAPPAGKDTVEVTLRLKRGLSVRGVVLDHAGQPVADAAVFAVGPTPINLAAGKAWTSFGDGEDANAKPVRTDAQGRFTLPRGEASSLAVSHVRLDAWVVPIPAEGEVTVRLPQAARLDIELDIEGADKDSAIFYQLLSHDMPGFSVVQSTHEVKVANPGKLSLAALPPGRYQVCRMKLNRLPQVGISAMLDRQFLELKAGETKSIRLVRAKGARLRGQVTGPADTKLSGAIVSVEAEKAVKGPFDDHEWTTVYASSTIGEGNGFLTERLAPGTYRLVAEAYVPLTPEQQFRTGRIRPAFRAEQRVEVVADGELNVGELVLKPAGE